MYTLIRAGFIALAFFCSLVCSLAAQAQEGIPPSLRDWQGWVMHGEEFRRCPFAASADAEPGEPIDAAEFRCVWPERLTLTVDARGGTFSQRWQVYSESWVQLPGNTEHWPREVRLNGAPAAVVAVGGVPACVWPRQPHGLRPLRVELAPGVAAAARRHRHRRSVRRRLTRRSTGASRWRRLARQAPQRRAGRRHGSAGLPAGAGRDPRLSTDAHPPQRGGRSARGGAGPRAARRLHAVVIDGRSACAPRARRHAARAAARRQPRDLPVRARHRRGAHAGAAGRTAAGKWPREEIWSFAANDSLRVAAAEGAEGIDPAQANVPGEWRQYPAFRMDASAKLNVVERSRGLSNADDNRLTLSRAQRGSISIIADSRPSTTSRASCAATGGSTCRRRSRCRARGRMTISCW